MIIIDRFLNSQLYYNAHVTVYTETTLLLLLLELNPHLMKLKVVV